MEFEELKIVWTLKKVYVLSLSLLLPLYEQDIARWMRQRRDGL